MQKLKPSHLMFWGGVLIATFAYLIRHTSPRHSDQGEVRNIVDIASEDSFPASDPPAY
jgi:hypothetical protein